MRCVWRSSLTENEVEGDMKTTVFTVYDGWHGQNNTVAVIDDWVHRLVFDDVKIVSQVAVCLYGTYMHTRNTSELAPLSAIVTASCQINVHLTVRKPFAAHLIEAHEFCGSVLLGLVKGFEADVTRGFSCVGEGARDGVQVMGSNGHQCPFPGSHL